MKGKKKQKKIGGAVLEKCKGSEVRRSHCGVAHHVRVTLGGCGGGLRPVHGKERSGFTGLQEYFRNSRTL